MLQRARAGSADPLLQWLLGDNMLLCPGATTPQPALCHQLGPPCQGRTHRSSVSQGGNVPPAAWCLRTQRVPARPRGLQGALAAAAAPGATTSPRREPGRTGQGEQLLR